MAGENLGRPAEAPDGRIYVPGGDLRVVLVLSADGERARAPSAASARRAGRFVLPVGVAFGPAGEVLVLDRLRAKILLFDPQHEFVTEFGSLGFGPGQFYHPVALAATADGKIYVAQGFQGRIQVFRLSLQRWRVNLIRSAELNVNERGRDQHRKQTIRSIEHSDPGRRRMREFGRRTSPAEGARRWTRGFKRPSSEADT